MRADSFTPTSAIGRPLDPSFPTNRAILLLAPLAAVAVVALGDRSLLGGAIAGAGSAFLGWALARELAPDYPLAAFGAALLSTLGLIVLPQPSLAMPFALLLLTRVVNRSVGPPATPIDTLATVAVVMLAAWTSASITLVLVAAAAFALDRRLPPIGPRRHAVLALVTGAVGLVGLVGSLIAGPGAPSRGLPDLACLAAASFFSVGIARTRRIASGADLGGAPLSAARVRAAMSLAPLVLFTGWLPGGPPVEALGIICATMIALVPSLVLASPLFGDTHQT
jgi:hypothetical protein